MPDDIFTSSDRCTCGHESHFFDRTINVMKKMSPLPKASEYLTPERLSEDARIREEIKAELPEIRERSREIHQEDMRNGTVPRITRLVLISERKLQGLTDDEIMARSGLDPDSLASMAGRDANPTIETMEAYAKALGKKLLIVLADEDSDADGAREPTDKAEHNA